MNIKDTLTENYGNFKLDVDKIELHSVGRREIKLPYTGKLPKPYDTSTISFRVNPERVCVILEGKTGKNKPIKYIVEASREEIDAILLPFFFKGNGHEHHTRTGNGLAAYWNGHHQAEYMAWHNIGQQPYRIADIIKQLPREQRNSLYRTLERMEQMNAAAG